MSTLLQMSFAGGMLIAVVAVLRLFLQKYIHRSVFLLLWFLAVVRLLVPIITPSPLSVFNLPLFSQEEAYQDIVVITPEETPPQESSSHLPEEILSSMESSVQTAPPMVTPEEQREFSVWQFLFLLWAGVGVLLAAFFLLSHLRSRRRYRFSLPVPEGVIIPEGLRVRMLDGLSAPLTYGIFRPTVLLPVDFCWEDPSRLEHVLLHEQAHIRRHDVLKKHILLLTVCIHWFNPAVWLMFFLACQDMEIRCDASAVKSLGKGGKLPYAQTLVAAESSRMTSLLDTGFSFSTTAKRLQALISAKHHPVISLLTAIALTLSLTGIFLTGEAAQAARPAVMLAPEELSADAFKPTETDTKKDRDFLASLTLPERKQTEIATTATTEETGNATSHSSHSSGNPSRIDTYFLPIFIEMALPQRIEVGHARKTEIYCGVELSFYSDNKAVASITIESILHPWDRLKNPNDPHSLDYYHRIKVTAKAAGVAHIYAKMTTVSYLIATVVVTDSTGGTGATEIQPVEILPGIDEILPSESIAPPITMPPVESTVPTEAEPPTESTAPTEAEPPTESIALTEEVPPTEAPPDQSTSPPEDGG